jgi:hypothetical protein
MQRGRNLPAVSWFCAWLLFFAVAPGRAADTMLGLGLGATAGFGVQADLTFEHFTRDLPLSLRLSGAYSSRDAGKALDARRVFINDNTNGTPQESAHTWQLRLDLLLPIARLGEMPVRLGIGPRKAFYTGTFDFVGGNEKFDVTSSPWGVGAILDAGFAVSDHLDFCLQLGLDHYFDARLEGHDTAYEPDGDHVNARRDYGWEQADDAINQPALEWFGLIGLRMRLGK